jgi:hypothetical protein
MSKTKANVQYTASGSDKPEVGDVMVWDGDEHVPKKFGVYYTFHTIAIKGLIPKNTYFPGFIIDESNGGVQSIVRVQARIRSSAAGHCRFAIYRRTESSQIDSIVIPSTTEGNYVSATENGTTITGSNYNMPFALDDEWYVYIKTIDSEGVNDLSITITVRHE